MSATPPTGPLAPPPPSQDECSMATLAQVLQIVLGWIAPLIIFLIRRQSRFVSFHALQALLLQILHVIAVMIFIVGFSIVIGYTVFSHMSSGQTSAGPPIAIILMLPFLYLFLIATNLTILVTAIVYCIKASRGEWAEYPVLGKWARHMLKIGPGGSLS